MVYVDDIVITRNVITGISSLNCFPHSQFHTKDLGASKYFLGVEMTKEQKKVFFYL